MTTLVRPVHSDPASDGSSTDLTVLLDTYADLIETLEANLATALGDITAAQTDITALEADAHDDEHALGGASHTGDALFSQLPALYARVTADFPKTNTTLANVTGAAVTLPISKTIKFSANVYVDGPTGGDIKIAWTIPAGATIKWNGSGGDVTTPATVVRTYVAASATSASFGTLGAGSPNVITVEGDVIMSTTAGDLQLQAAQVAASGTSNVLIGTSIIAWIVT